MARALPSQIGLVLAYTGLATYATPYVAAALYFLINKTIPAELAWDTWYHYWQAYGADPLQHQRLIIAAGSAASLVLGAPLVLLLKAWSRGRPLHGDARWATASEIRKADLL